MKSPIQRPKRLSRAIAGPARRGSNALALRFGRELLGIKNPGVDADDQDLLVVGAVEDAYAPAFGERPEAAPEVVVV